MNSMDPIETMDTTSTCPCPRTRTDLETPSATTTTATTDNVDLQSTGSITSTNTSSASPTAKSLLPNDEEMSSFYSPPPMTHHLDYKSKTNIRRAELEVLRQKQLAKPKAALLQSAQAPKENLAEFESKQRQHLQQQRLNERAAMDLLHQFRADEDLLLYFQGSPDRLKRPPTRPTRTTPPDATATSTTVYVHSSEPSYNKPKTMSEEKQETITTTTQARKKEVVVSVEEDVDTLDTLDTTSRECTVDPSDKIAHLTTKSTVLPISSFVPVHASTGTLTTSKHPISLPTPIPEPMPIPMINNKEDIETKMYAPVILPNLSNTSNNINVETATKGPMILTKSSQQYSKQPTMGPIVLPISKSKSKDESKKDLQSVIQYSEESLLGPVILPTTRTMDESERIPPYQPVTLPICQSRNECENISQSQKATTSLSTILPTIQHQHKTDKLEDCQSLGPIVLPTQNLRDQSTTSVLVDSSVDPILLPVTTRRREQWDISNISQSQNGLPISGSRKESAMTEGNEANIDKSPQSTTEDVSLPIESGDHAIVSKEPIDRFKKVIPTVMHGMQDISQSQKNNFKKSAPASNNGLVDSYEADLLTNDCHAMEECNAIIATELEIDNAISGGIISAPETKLQDCQRILPVVSFGSNITMAAQEQTFDERSPSAEKKKETVISPQTVTRTSTSKATSKATSEIENERLSLHESLMNENFPTSIVVNRGFFESEESSHDRALLHSPVPSVMRAAVVSPETNPSPSVGLATCNDAPTPPSTKLARAATRRDAQPEAKVDAVEKPLGFFSFFSMTTTANSRQRYSRYL